MGNAIRKILLPTDFSEVAENAIHTAVAICTRQGAALVLAHVVVDQFPLLSTEAGALPLDATTDYEEAAAEALSELARPLKERFEIPVSTLVLRGDPATELCQWSGANDVDLIVMGSHGASGLREFFMGSNAYRVVKHASCPVMTLPGTNRWIEFRRILFPIRLVPEALSKYDVIRPIIRGNNSSLIIAGVVKRGDEGGASIMEQLLGAAAKKMKEDDVNFQSEVHLAEDVAKHVIHLSETENPDLLVITATFESDHPIRDFFIGPYTQQIVNHCKCPVLSIRGEHDEIHGDDVGVVSFA
jgi:nucleotide-binding universal stress UspA family protein